MREDILLFLAVFAVWLLLAIAYAVIPALAMPGYAVVWGWGAVVFAGLALGVALAVRRSRRRP